MQLKTGNRCVRLTHHVRERMVEFGLRKQDLRDVIDRAEVTYRQDGRTFAQRGRWTVTFVEDGDCVVIITVLRRTVERWEHA